MLINARASHMPHSPRKVQLIAAALLGKKVDDALTLLKFSPMHASAGLVKVLKQAIGNAKTNFSVDSANLVIKEAFATKGRTWKKVRFAGRGRRRMYEKITSHITIRLESKEPKILNTKSIKNGPKS